MTLPNDDISIVVERKHEMETTWTVAATLRSVIDAYLYASEKNDEAASRGQRWSYRIRPDNAKNQEKNS